MMMTTITANEMMCLLYTRGWCCCCCCCWCWPNWWLDDVCCLPVSSLPEVDKLEGAACPPEVTSSVDTTRRSPLPVVPTGDRFRPLYIHNKTACAVTEI